jgi:hypothetical protein
MEPVAGAGLRRMSEGAPDVKKNVPIRPVFSGE